MPKLGKNHDVSTSTVSIRKDLRRSHGCHCSNSYWRSYAHLQTSTASTSPWSNGNVPCGLSRGQRTLSCSCKPSRFHRSSSQCKRIKLGICSSRQFSTEIEIQVLVPLVQKSKHSCQKSIDPNLNLNQHVRDIDSTLLDMRLSCRESQDSCIQTKTLSEPTRKMVRYACTRSNCTSISWSASIHVWGNENIVLCPLRRQACYS